MLVAAYGCKRTAIKEEAKRFKTEAIAKAQITKFRNGVSTDFPNAQIHQIDDDDLVSVKKGSRAEAKAEMLVQLNALRRALAAFDLAAFDQVNASENDFAILADKAMLFSESTTEWLNYDARR